MESKTIAPDVETRMSTLEQQAEAAANDALAALLAAKRLRPEYDGEDPWMTFYWALGGELDHETIKPLIIDAATRALRTSVASGSELP